MDDAPRGLRLWLMAARPRTLTIAVAPVLVGAAWAWGDGRRMRPLALLAALAAAMLIQAGTNLWNDVGDGVRGGDRPTRSGPPRVTARGWATPREVRRAAVVCFAAAALLGLYLARVGGWPIVALGAASLLAGWAYSSGPWPLSHTPLGELFVVAFFGVGAVAGTVWLQGVAPTWPVLVLGVALGLPAAAVLMVNNHRDRDEDRAAGRRTLALVLGPRRSRVVYAALLLLAPLLMVLPGLPPRLVLALPLLLLALPLARRFRAGGAALNPLLGQTALYQMALAVVLAVSLLL